MDTESSVWTEEEKRLIAPQAGRRIRNQADRFEFAAVIFWTLGLIAFFVGIICAASDSQTWGIIGASVCGGFVLLGLWTFLLAQVMHIRANTEK